MTLRQDPGQCGICRSPLSGVKLTACGTCRALYHPDCWEWSGKRCSTYACGTAERAGDRGYVSSIDLRDLQKRADRLIDEGKNEQAVGILTTLLEKDPKDPGALALRGLAFWRLGKNDEANADFRETLRIRPDHPETLFNLAGLLLEEGRTADARQLLKRCLEHAPPGWPTRPDVQERLARLKNRATTWKLLAIVFILAIAGTALLSC